MAPTALTQSPLDVPTPKFNYNKPSKSVFPDGIKTSGQTYPDYSRLKPYSAFPKEITGPTVWKSEDYKNNPERWTHRFGEEEISEISDAADAFIQSGTPLTGITKVNPTSVVLRTEVAYLLVGQISASKVRGFPHHSSQRDLERQGLPPLQRLPGPRMG